MDEKKLSKLSREELLKRLLMETEKNAALSVRLDELEAELSDFELKARNYESLAHAALRISKVFEAADEAARLYLEDVQMLAGGGAGHADKLMTEAREKSAAMVENTTQLCRKRLETADRQCKLWHDRTEEECREMIAQAEAECDRMLAKAEESCRVRRAEAERYYRLAAEYAAKYNLFES